MKRLITLSLTLVLAVVLSGCAVNPVTGRTELMLMSEAQEIQMGKDLYPSALWGAEGGGGEYRDEELKAYLGDIVSRIHGVSHRPQLPVKFAIQNSSIPNAWAIPGYVVITRGLLAGLESEAGFVFVMGHEIGHVSARHSARQFTYGMLQQMGLAAAGIALQGREYSDAILGLGAVGSTLILLKYSRSDELEADRLGILYMTRLGYDPKNAITAHRNLERTVNEYLKGLGKETRERGFFEDLLSTHPRTSVRIEEIRKMIEEVGPFEIKGDGTGKERFLAMTADIRKVNDIYVKYYDRAVRAFQDRRFDEAERLIGEAIERDDNQPPFYTLRGFLAIESKDLDGAEEDFNIALDIDDRYQPAYRGLGIYHYKKNDYAPAIENLKKALAMYPQDVSSHYYLGLSYYKTGAYARAVEHLRVFESAQPRHPEIHGLLGMSYERMRKLGAAYNEYILQLRVAPDNEMGRYARERAIILRPLVERP